jgi:voltage-dependent anion channel protein 2
MRAAQSGKDLLLGTAKGGAFSLDNKLSFASSTANGVSFNVSATQKADRVDSTLKVAYSHAKYSADASFDPAGKVSVSSSVSDVAPGLKLTGSMVLPDPASAKAGLEYAFPYLSLKSTVSLSSTPVVDASATTGYKNVLVGGEAAFDSAKSAVTKYNVRGIRRSGG